MCAKFQCSECHHEFSAEICGKAAEFEVYRCDQCDRVLRAEKSPTMPEHLDEPCQCGGRYWKGRPPKCPNCRSPQVKVEE